MEQKIPIVGDYWTGREIPASDNVSFPEKYPRKFLVLTATAFLNHPLVYGVLDGSLVEFADIVLRLFKVRRGHVRCIYPIHYRRLVVGFSNRGSLHVWV